MSCSNGVSFERKGFSVLEVLVAVAISALITLAVLVQIRGLVKDKKLERQVNEVYEELSVAEYVMKTDLTRIGVGMLINDEGEYTYPSFSWNGVNKIVLRGSKADDVVNYGTVMVNCGALTVTNGFPSGVVGYNAYVLGENEGCYVNGNDPKSACSIYAGRELIEKPFFAKPNGCCVETGSCNKDVACFKTTYEFVKDGDFYVLNRDGAPLIKNVGSFGVFYSLDENGDGVLEPSELNETGPVTVKKPNALKAVFVVMIVKVDYLRSNVGVKDEGANVVVQVGKTIFTLKKPLNWSKGHWIPVVVAAIPTEKQVEEGS